MLNTAFGIWQEVVEDVRVLMVMVYQEVML